MDLLYLALNKLEVLEFLITTTEKEFKWHLAQLLPRLKLSKKELKTVMKRLTAWAFAKKESKIVRVTVLQSLFVLSDKHKDLEWDFHSVVQEVEKENVPSNYARIRKLKSR